MEILNCNLDGVRIIKHDIHGDNRGYFVETFNKEKLPFLPEFKQSNMSFSRINVLRGLHYQETQPQGKLVTVMDGCAFDAIVNINPNHPQFGKWFGIKLKPGISMWVPPFYAHGFYTLDETIFSYHCSDLYKSGDGKVIDWNSCGIDWPIDEEFKKIGPFMSNQDSEGELFINFAARMLRNG